MLSRLLPASSPPSPLEILLMSDCVKNCPRRQRLGIWGGLAAFVIMMPGVVLAGGKLAPSSHPVIAGFQRFHAAAGGDLIQGGQLLLGELNCVSCHHPDMTQGTNLPRSAPNLDNVGSRVKHAYLRRFLSSPQTAKPGTAMPDLFVGDPERTAKIEALVHFLAATGIPRMERPDKKLSSLGKDLYNKVGCVACHGTRNGKGDADKLIPSSVPLGDLRAKYTLASLRLFLENPHQVRPSGRMPSLLNPKEAAEVANYLLQGIATPPSGPAGNLKYSYYEGDWDKLPNFAKLKPIATGEAEAFDVHVARRVGNMAIKFEGYLHLERAGSYQFHLTSDDGSKLWIDDKVVVDHDGIHSPSTKSASVELFKGTHKLVVAVFNGGGGVELGLEIEGPGLGRQSAAAFVSTAKNPVPTKIAAPKQNAEDENLEPDAVLVEKGRAVFASAGCASCHQMKLKGTPPVPAMPLAKLKAEGGCLAEQPTKGTPWFALSKIQRTALVAALKSPALPSNSPAEVVRRTMVTFNCFACHERSKIGGIEEALSSNFTTTQQEMGEEGRVPPSLNGVGAKLKPDYLARILDKGVHDRPYMNTRMPGFGAANVGHLVKLFEQLDPVLKAATVALQEPLSKVKVDARHMVGVQALGCVRCHTFAGKKAEGVQGIDMTLMPQRLRREWFHQYLLDPNKFRPGTRMPTSWPEGKSQLLKVLDGKADTQIEAIWTYLGDGAKAKLPIGTNKQFIPLTPIGTDAVIYRNFIEGAGSRAIGVGYPEKVNLAFDANELRLALVWQGAFIDAARHWTDRGVGFEPPLGDNVLHLPNGAGFAQLKSALDAWPTQKAKELGYRFRGYDLTPEQRPTFKYTLGEITVTDQPNAVADKGTPKLVRTLRLTGPATPDNLYFRAAAADKIEALGDGWYRINGEYRMKIDGAEPQLRRSENKTELIVPVHFHSGQARIVQEIAW
jgi:mono/diheme cytochrome c family protein